RSPSYIVGPAHPVRAQRGAQMPVARTSPPPAARYMPQHGVAGGVILSSGCDRQLHSPDRMATAALEAAIIARPPPRDLLADLDMHVLTRRSDRRGAVQLAAHAGCMAATGLLVWLAMPYWFLLVPAMALHGVTIVTLFAPMH